MNQAKGKSDGRVLRWVDTKDVQHHVADGRELPRDEYWDAQRIRNEWIKTHMWGQWKKEEKTTMNIRVSELNKMVNAINAKLNGDDVVRVGTSPQGGLEISDAKGVIDVHLHMDQIKITHHTRKVIKLEPLVAPHPASEYPAWSIR